ncbi:thioredoxin family protein [Yinghuangia seranimata]|uniref:thioredoxin family protein n=1 Tax=Yinghuangia seranimata TaxID=408067 RepID=UPI00248C9F5B|nr:thioredoxin family protein [Yinghuangia seranimata]MDI2131864.1 thioredoxin family protein [Yinghuangia seranimata]
MSAGIIVVAVVLAAATAVGLWRRRNDGRMRDVAERTEAAAPALDPAEIGVTLGTRATFVQFSTAFCSPCRTTRLLLGQIAGELDGVVHAEVDAEKHLDLVRRLDISRTPTVLVLDARGHIVRRATGVPRRQDALAAVALAVSPA